MLLRKINLKGLRRLLEMKVKSTIRKIFKFIGFLLAVFVVCLFSTIVYLQFAEEKVVFDEEEAARVSYTPLKEVVPGKDLPFTGLFKSNNNVDIVKFNGRFYCSFRSAPTHFASAKTMLHVMSSTDGDKWEKEISFNYGSDVREPRFLVFKDKLFLYFFKGGANPLSFAPDHMYATEFVREGQWTKPRKIYEPGYVVWRAKEHGGRAYMSVYYGVGLYSNETNPTHLQLLISDDGYNWKTVDGTDISTETSAEEGEFEFDDEGNLYATIRLEMKGGKVCYAPKERLSAWACKFSPYKYDSALMFRRGQDFYVIARRNVAGAYNRKSGLLPETLRSKWYLARYSLTRKRTALYKLDKAKMELLPVMDFPSRGDTAYAGLAQLSKDKYLMFNYSSDITGFDWSWLGGQLTGSRIYSTVLEFKE